MKKKIISTVFFGILTTGTLGYVKSHYIKELIFKTESSQIEDNFYDKYEMNTLQAVKNHLLHNQLLYSNDNINTKVQILYLEYLLKNNQEKEFKQMAEAIMKSLMTKEELIAVGGYIQDESIQPVHKASLEDNLKMYKLAVRAHKNWDDPLYQEIANLLEEQMYKYNVVKGKLYSYYDSMNDIREGEVELGDIDLKALAVLENHSVDWKGLLQKGKDIVEKGFISRSFPLYYTYYNYDEKTYSTQEKLDTLESLLIVQDLSENGLYKSETIKWLKEQIKAGGIYEQYDSKTGMITSHQETIAIYAVISQIGKNVGDIELYTLAMEKMLSFQVKDKENRYFGAFIEKGHDELNEYDIVQALLAF